ncbi:hypothetical protein HID58_010535 [Brassica napus]|uniref:Uncharacterized protein n=1 Tax=Brassica napus TaxID=3708 RepID=A0ABQ8DVP3_BRANA|nr:hypothetical protein HID58_010535 [Brassica napus]
MAIFPMSHSHFIATNYGKVKKDARSFTHHKAGSEESVVGEESVKRTYIFVKGVLHITRQVHSSLYKRVSCTIVCGSAKNSLPIHLGTSSTSSYCAALASTLVPDSITVYLPCR